MANNNQQALAELAQSLKLDGLQFDNDNVCELVFEDETIVTLTADTAGTQLQISGLVGDLEDPNSPTALRTLLEANFNAQGVGAAALGMDHISHEVFLGQSLNVNQLDANGLAGALEPFVNYLTFWRENLTKLTSAAPDASSGEVAGMMQV